MAIQIAGLQDIAALEQLMNKAYRGSASRKGWTTEADLLEGDLRTDSEELSHLMNAADTIILKYELDEQKIVGCVMLRKEEKKLYLGMLSVEPEMQAHGIGKKLLQAADEYAAKNFCESIYMTVISVRTELIAWYCRHGYEPTGEIKPFLVDIKYGKPTQYLEFIVLAKKIIFTNL